MKEGNRVAVRFSEQEWLGIQTVAATMETRDYTAALLNGTLQNYEQWVLDSEGPARDYLCAEQAGREAIATRRYGVTDTEGMLALTSSWKQHPKSAPKAAAVGSRGRRSALGYDIETASVIVRKREAKVWVQTRQFAGMQAIATMLGCSVATIARKRILGLPLFIAEDSTTVWRLEKQAEAIITEAERIRALVLVG